MEFAITRIIPAGILPQVHPCGIRHSANSSTSAHRVLEGSAWPQHGFTWDDMGSRDPAQNWKARASQGCCVVISDDGATANPELGYSMSQIGCFLASGRAQKGGLHQRKLHSIDVR